MLKRKTLRLAAIFLLVISGSVIVYSYATYGTPTPSELNEQSELPRNERAQLASPSNGTTVITGQGTMDSSDGPSLTAIDSNGRILYHNDTYNTYLDVDPVSGKSHTVLYIGAVDIPADQCHSSTPCRKNVVETENLSTGNTTRLHEYTYPRLETRTQDHTNRWHDVDRINDTHLLVADITQDTVFIVNTTNGIRTWTWTAQSDYPLKGGGQYFRDWTHLNDVEYLQDGRIMVSLRNQDQVVFIDPKRGLLENWTLGAEDNHSVLYEQHNPDYIPPEQGGPAVLVADSENNRVIEYTREDGEWNQSWMWQDHQIEWPRDADRLPNGHTLITDVHGGRILEINRSGGIVWQFPFDGPYEAERLNTGDESTNGPTASRANLTSRHPPQLDSGTETTAQNAGLLTRIKSFVKSLIPAKLLHGLLFLLPGWMVFYTDIAFLIFVTTLVGWAVIEGRNLIRHKKVGIQSPITTGGGDSGDQ